MTREEVSHIEAEFGITFPLAYCDAITESYPFGVAAEELDTEAESLRRSNQSCRKDGAWGFPWRQNYWRIGGDGAGGFYCIDTQQSDSTVYFCDHEDMPISIESLNDISVSSFQEFINDVTELESNMTKWGKEMKERVAHRRWWQFWIPKQWSSK